MIGIMYDVIFSESRSDHSWKPRGGRSRSRSRSRSRRRSRRCVSLSRNMGCCVSYVAVLVVEDLEAVVVARPALEARAPDHAPGPHVAGPIVHHRVVSLLVHLHAAQHRHRLMYQHREYCWHELFLCAVTLLFNVNDVFSVIYSVHAPSHA